MLTQRIIVEDLKHLHAIQNHIPGELAYVKDTKEIFTWDEEKGWVKIAVDNQGIDFNLYELNKSVVGQLDPMTLDEIKNKANLFNDYRESTDNTHYMLLCKDFSYYTIFTYSVMPSFSTFAEAIITIITELGDIYNIECLDDGAIEIWIKPTGEESPYAFYLFPYDAGVVYYG